MAHCRWVAATTMMAAWWLNAPRAFAWHSAAPLAAARHVSLVHRAGRSTRALASTSRELEVRNTIYAVSSGAGVRSGVAVIRVSGPDARVAAQRMTRKGRADPSLEWLRPRYATLAKLLAPASDEPLDSSLVLWFPGPRSFTGEDVLELHVHGGRAVVAAVLGALGSLPGHRMAEAGEFTRRAFGNGQMDLTEVEGLSDLLAANTDAQRRQALTQMGGAARETFDGWRAELLNCLAHTEAVIDFGDDEDDVDDVSVLGAVGPRVRELAAGMRGALANARRGELLRDGPRVVIVGAPNAGKVRARGRARAVCARPSAQPASERLRRVRAPTLRARTPRSRACSTVWPSARPRSSPRSRAPRATSSRSSWNSAATRCACATRRGCAPRRRRT